MLFLKARQSKLRFADHLTHTFFFNSLKGETNLLEIADAAVFRGASIICLDDLILIRTIMIPPMCFVAITTKRQKGEKHSFIAKANCYST